MTDTQNHPDHPVWAVYDEMRTARLNVKCLQGEIRLLGAIDLGSHVIIAVASTSSIGGFWFFQNFVGGYLWKTIGALAILATVLKPVFGLTDKIRHKQELLTSYQILDHDLHCICIEIRYQEKYDDTLHKEFKKALQRKVELVKKPGGSFASTKTLEKYQLEVNKELPLDSFYLPE